MFVVVVNGIGVAVHAADSGVSLGVNVISIGPPTINDFNYSALNISTPTADSDLTENANLNSSIDQAAPIADSGSVKGEESNQTINQTEVVKDKGLVKGTASEKPPSWFKKQIDRFVDFFKRIF